MEKKSKRLDDKKADTAKGDKTNLLVKVFEELDITDFLPNRDRGDTKCNFGNRSLKNLTSEKSQKKVGISVSEVKPRKQDDVLDSDDSCKNHHRKLRKEKKYLEESKGTTAFMTVKNHKTESKTRSYSEQTIKSKVELEKIDGRRKADIEETARIEDKLKIINENAKIGEEGARFNNIRNMRLPPGKDLKFIEKDALERRKLLRERYTVKLKNSNKNVESKDNFKCDVVLELKNDESETFDREKFNESPKDILQLEQARKTKEPGRKPIIKTIRNNDHRVYKAVTFIDDKETTPLQIKIPNSKKSAETNTVRNKLKDASKESVQIIKETTKTTHVKKNIKEKRHTKRLKRRPSSPALINYQPSPQTEVAKWAPSSINQHTKPYYEAWVDTTLAAIAKGSEKDKLNFSKQHLFKTFKRALELDSRPDTPCLVYEKVNDEKYMGRITVNKSK